MWLVDAFNLGDADLVSILASASPIQSCQDEVIGITGGCDPGGGNQALAAEASPSTGPVSEREVNAQSSSALPEGFFSTFQNLADRSANGRVFETSRRVGNGGQPPMLMRPGIGDDDLVGIGVDHKVRVVRYHYDLPLCLGRDEERNQLVKDRLGIKILFRLIDDERTIIGIVER